MQRLGWHSLNTTFDCECGQRHALPIEACHVGEDAAARLAAFAKTKGKSVLMVSDENTRAAAGEAVDLYVAIGSRRPFCTAERDSACIVFEMLTILHFVQLGCRLEACRKVCIHFPNLSLS